MWIIGWRWSCIYKDVKYEINTNISNSVDWDVDGSVGAKVGVCNNVRLDSDVNDQVGSSDVEGV